MLFPERFRGIMVISQASPMAQEIVGMSALQAAGIVGLIRCVMGWVGVLGVVSTTSAAPAFTCCCT